jgi:hypothetical protein
MARTAVVAGTATAVSNRVARRQANRWEAQEVAAQQEAWAAQPPPPPPQQTWAPPPPPVETAPLPVDPTTAQLEKLASLHNAGVLSDEEFSAAKAKLLGI